MRCYKTAFMITIKIGDKQPLDCPICKDKLGYRTSDYLRTHYYDFYSEDGEKLGGDYFDCQHIINKLKTTVCHNCGSKLPFNVDRS